MRKLLSMLLCVPLLLSMTAAAAFGQDGSYSNDNGSVSTFSKSEYEVLTSVFFASDAQFYHSYTPGLFGDNTITSCQPVVDTLVRLAKENGHDIETFVFGGDYTQNDGKRNPADSKDVEVYGPNANSWHYGNNPKYSIPEIKDAIDNYYAVKGDDNYIFLQGNHEPDITDKENYGLTPSGAYEFDNYIVYVLNDQDYVGLRPRTQDLSKQAIAQDADGNLLVSQITDATAVVTDVANALNAYLEKLIEKGDTRPVFIASHQPLYSERLSDYNGNAKIIFNAINDAAKKLDIIFFFGHTHQKVDEIGGGLSYVSKGEKLKVCNNPDLASEPLTYDEETINFTYMNFGHLARYSGTNAVLSSTVIDITKDKLILTRYGAKDKNILAKTEINRINPVPDKILAQISGINVKSFTYDGSTAAKYTGAPKATVNGMDVDIDEWKYEWYKGSDMLDEAPVSSGEYTLVVTACDNEYYGSMSITFEIAKVPVTIKPDDKRVTVKNDMPGFSITALGLLDKHQNSVDEILSDAVLTANIKTTENTGTFTITWNNMDSLKSRIEALDFAENYSFTFSDEGTLRIARRSSSASSASTASSKTAYVTITFVTNTDEKITPQRVETGSVVTNLPTPKEVPDKLFTGWYTDKSCTEEYKAGKSLSAPLTLYAGWKYDSGIISPSSSDSIVLLPNSINYTAFGTEKTMDVSPAVLNQRVYVPLRFIAENLGSDVSWVQKEQKAVIRKDNNTIELYLTLNTAYVNGELKDTDVGVIVKNERILAPIKFISENLNADVNWDAETNEIIVTPVK